MTIFHRFYILNTNFNNESDKYLSSATCLFIGAKVCNELIPLNEIVKEYLILYVKKTNINIIINEAIILDISEKICFYEFEILSKIGFNLNIDLPYKYMDLMVNYVLKTLRNPKFLVISTNFVNDSFKLPICLYYNPKIIALAGIYITKVFFNINLSDTSDGLKWYQIIDVNVDFEKIVEVSNYFNKIYEFSSKCEGKNLNEKKNFDNLYNHNIKINQSYNALLNKSINNENLLDDSNSHTRKAFCQNNILIDNIKEKIEINEFKIIGKEKKYMLSKYQISNTDLIIDNIIS